VLKEWTSWLPFELIYYRPLTILLGKATAAENGWTLTKDLIWLVLLSAMATTAWLFGRKKLVVQGG
jgi:ABC-2 type transport system permease protein